MTRKPKSEEALLARIASRFPHNVARRNARAISLGIGDDAALLRPTPGCEQVLTCDWFLEGTHFLIEKHPPDAVGWKCLARAISDLAAMGGRPVCFLMSLALPEKNAGRWLDEFLRGLRRVSKKFECPLVGGDITRRDDTLINITVVGEVPTGSAVLRAGARPGDIIYVSGRLGEAELGWKLLQRGQADSGSKNALTRTHLYPEPRLELGRWLREKKLATSMMDVSDGLSSDLPKLCLASSVGAIIELGTIPCVQIPIPLKRQGYNAQQLALHGGDDYELLFTVSPRNAVQLPGKFTGLPLTPIGRITRARKIQTLDKSGNAKVFQTRGWDPFRN